MKKVLVVDDEHSIVTYLTVVLEDAVVTEFLWINPHPLIKADYTDEQGNVQQWTMEMGSTVSAQLVGWTRTALQPGDVVVTPPGVETRRRTTEGAVAAPADAVTPGPPGAP